MYSQFTYAENQTRLQLAKIMGFKPTLEQEGFFVLPSAFKTLQLERREGKTTLIAYDLLTAAMLKPITQIISNINNAGSQIIIKYMKEINYYNKEDIELNGKNYWNARININSNDKISFGNSAIHVVNRDTKKLAGIVPDRIFCDNAEFNVTPTWIQSATTELAHKNGDLIIISSGFKNMTWR